MIVHIDVGVKKENGKWVGRWKSTNAVTDTLLDHSSEILANRREELERKLDKALRLAFPKASYIIQHRDNMGDWNHA